MQVTPLVVHNQEQGVKAITREDIRWQRCDVKANNRLANVLLAQQAAEAQAEDCIIINQNRVLEGTTCNIFVIKFDKHLNV